MANLMVVVKLATLMFFAGQNCLHLASVQGFLSLVENMVDLGANIDAKVSNTHKSYENSNFKNSVYNH